MRRLSGAIVFFLAAAAFFLPAQEQGAGGAASAAAGEEDFSGYFPLEAAGITVTASPAATQMMLILTREDIEQARADGLAGLLQNAAGLSVTRYGGYGGQAEINIRGFDSSRVAFLINGVPANGALDSGFDINSVNLDSIERIEVIQGGSDTRFNVSGALGGVINIITIGKPEPGLRVSASLANTAALPGAYTYYSGGKRETGAPRWEDLADAQKAQAALGWGTEASALRAGIFANRAANHFLYYYPDFNETRRADNSEVYDGGGDVSYLRQFGSRAKFIASGSVYYGDKNIPVSFTAPLAGKQRDFSTRAGVFFDAPRVFRDGLALEASVSHGFQRLDFTAASVGDSARESRHDQNSVNAANRWAWFASDALTLRAGGDFRWDSVDSTDAGRHGRPSGGLYGTAEYSPAQSLLLIASLKGVFAQGAAEAVPKLGLLWTPRAALTLKANGFRCFKLPDFQDLYWDDGQSKGSPDLRPEDGWGADAGVACKAGGRWEAEAAAFFQWTEDSIHWASAGGGLWRPQNIARAALMGVDAKAAVNLPPFAFFDRPAFQVSYRCLLTFLLSYGYTWADRKRVPYQPEHTISASLTLPWNSGNNTCAGSFVLHGRWESVRYADMSNITALETPVLIDVTVNQKVTETCAVFVAARNLLNRPYESFDDYYLPGLTITAGARVECEPKGEKK
ncbi:MAG: TonB-dependent receptor/vitamin B12 transporter BtuB [Treponematales bacterium]